LNKAFLGKDKDAIVNLVDSLIAELDVSVLVSGSLAIKIYEDETPKFNKGQYNYVLAFMASKKRFLGISYQDLAAVLSITNCKQVKSLDKKARQRNVIHLAITEIGCPRIKTKSSLSVPLVTNQNSIVQTIKDLRDMNTLTWDSVILLHDTSVPESILVSMVNTLSENGAVATFELGDNPGDSISGLLADLPARKLGNKFMVITKEVSIAIIHQRMEDVGLLNINTEVLYLVTDTDQASVMEPEQIKKAQDGYNVAFLYNSSNSNNNADCKSGLFCVTEELIRMYVASIQVHFL
jgi:hypothetical protein